MVALVFLYAILNGVFQCDWFVPCLAVFRSYLNRNPMHLDFDTVSTGWPVMLCIFYILAR